MTNWVDQNINEYKPEIYSDIDDNDDWCFTATFVHIVG